VINNFLDDERKWVSCELLRKSESSEIYFLLREMVRNIFDVKICFFIDFIEQQFPMILPVVP
jgi:hypothetical protein